ncbi:MAG: peptidyl-prolyl cis-trans isomerase [Halioglobus sp.]
MDKSSSKHAVKWLALGAVVGALLAASGLVEDTLAPLDEDIIASINGENIYRSQYQSYADLLQQDRPGALSDKDRQHILNRLIDEKLLIRHGQQSGLVQTDPAVRKAIVDAVIENIISSRKGAVAEEAELQQFYEENGAYFSQAPLLQVQRMVFYGPRAKARSEQAYSALAKGEPFAQVQQELADREVLSLPDTPIPASRLPGYLGPSQAAIAGKLTRGQISQPIESGDHWTILQLLDRVPGQSPPLSEIRDQVQREFQRRGNDQALRTQLDELRADADVRINTSLLQQTEN